MEVISVSFWGLLCRLFGFLLACWMRIQLCVEWLYVLPLVSIWCESHTHRGGLKRIACDAFGEAWVSTRLVLDVKWSNHNSVIILLSGLHVLLFSLSDPSSNRYGYGYVGCGDYCCCDGDCDCDRDCALSKWSESRERNQHPLPTSVSINGMSLGNLDRHN